MKLYGLQAISAHNGWAMAALGISIVFTGLTLLSIAISQLHMLLDCWENIHVLLTKLKKTAKNGKMSGSHFLSEPKKSNSNIKKAAKDYKLLTERLAEPFSLPELLYLAKNAGLDKPHSTINEMLLTGIISPDGKGFFYWND